ncbi:mitochondrial substrate carrier family protein [Heterostelium album PN500]|uniref:Mitochondrial substrate carrier family protein n=1 Tax=Heterostelium pallidum (strain ATCC 26659 / Pp 5 / PN500) TaxID=670386 RepID=D3BEF7_HETP5|nr:mitochondrial substrate carrier family protein [Heterostelium album PN500]EFA80288.1 mitochondrial substrate carrier family protein [Heterostelium album PN500]|eukprot:XP_020432408.1 mitochondrial substrate carrier family protein [Heterostelium album PN500]
MTGAAASTGKNDEKKHVIFPWKRMVAGAVAGTADVWACHPLDRIKTQLQNNPGKSIFGTFQDVVSKGKGFTGGVYALYEGILPMTAEAIFKVGIRYFAFSWFTEEYNQRYNNGRPPKDPFFLNLAGGAFAGTVESFLVVIPCELLKVRHMTQEHSRSFGMVFKDVIREEGFRGLYKGGSATLLRQITNHMIRFPVFYGITDYLKGGDHHKQLPVIQNLTAGALAGTASTLFNNPLDTIKTRMQKQGQNQTSMQVIRGIYADGGARAFWAGCVPRILRVAPGQAITWAVVEWVTGLLNKF